ncbi:hypothetical protein PPERSA_05092 [Pseudocohnilembus persalinus]|uniref:Transmembrane protein n=1 Tax=Pseudocohnilembus persalinus TaxID=266149 RepID=A0A0V0QVX6_PSEPJ|nr:hypothetical protein PPERSA_05092 [Pseudocohnilembus persalinus]|eukprot:KRX06479.1 hypothetical protein PPERSA_05092 [Pseudocohnilembus persalinus]
MKLLLIYLKQQQQNQPRKLGEKVVYSLFQQLKKMKNASEYQKTAKCVTRNQKNMQKTPLDLLIFYNVVCCLYFNQLYLQIYICKNESPQKYFNKNQYQSLQTNFIYH